MAAPGTVTSGVRTVLRTKVGERLFRQAEEPDSTRAWMMRATVEAL